MIKDEVGRDAMAASLPKRIAAAEDAEPADVARQRWNSMLFELLHYRAVHGDMKLRSKDDVKHRKLYDWIVQQRREFKNYHDDPMNSNLTSAQVEVLNSIQFPWNTRGEEHWQLHFELLVAFKEEHGHTLVSRSDQANPKLSLWVVDQRRQMKLWKEGKNTTMTKERQRLLDDVGFVWQVRNKSSWEIRFKELLEYKEKHGTTVVPQHYKENKALGKWVAKQREQYRFLKEGRHSFLTPDRLELLNTCGFIWSLKGRAPKEEIVDQATLVHTPTTHLAHHPHVSLAAHHHQAVMVPQTVMVHPHAQNVHDPSVVPHHDVMTVHQHGHDQVHGAALQHAVQAAEEAMQHLEDQQPM
eukprot:CAMPEP_0194070140 /NCGR_PEP_ID=MMETSP0009_2-20130614/88023_1 /TAXON_ID=210454 /ORGANISM="Grammatophora oceanica, Strain CCMP 410" /LENGTH=354 /DNA_ID=CAMNT_0038723391 /DNA_START=218 /DNA_END=1282 /DNA_ORIENTATION=-